MPKCETTKQAVDKCKCMDCTNRRIIRRMYDNGYEKGKLEIEARAPEMEQELRKQYERANDRAGCGDGVRPQR